MFSKVLTASVLSRISDEDLCSQLNYIWTAYIIAAMSILVTMVQYVGSPIYCWCPAELPQVQCNYTMALCWVQENYHVHEKEPIPVEEEDRYHTTVTYYPWVPWILMLMSGVLNLPHLIWRAFESSSGLDLRKLVSLADSHDSTENLAKILRIWLARTSVTEKNFASTMKTFLGSIGVFKMGKHYRTYLCGLVILVKFLYLLVSGILYFSLNVFIDEDFISYGYEVVDNFMRGIPQNSHRFPKQTLCDIQIRQMSNVHTYSMQCLLPINVYNEKIFIFLWFWFHVVILVNAYSLVAWTFHLLSFSNRRRFVKGYVIILIHLIRKKKKHRSGDKEEANFLSEKDCRRTKNNGADYGNDADDGFAEQDSLNHIVEENGTASDAIFKGLNGDCIDQENDELTQSTDFITRNRPKLAKVKPVKRRGTRAIRDLISHLGQPTSTSRQPSIETNELEIVYEKRKREINRITAKMLKHFGHDGVVVLRILEHTVGIVIANEIFQELYQQLNDINHFR